MGVTNYPNGIASFGIPVLPAISSMVRTGSVYFVCNATNANGSNGNSGADPGRPVVDKAATNNAGQFVTLSSKIIGGARFLRNILTVVGATGTTVGVFGTGSGSTSSGIVANNYVWSLDTTTALLFTASTGLRFIENYMSGAVDKSGTLFPAADDPA